MKVLSIQEAQRQLAVVCNEALGGEIIRVQLENGERIELTPVPRTAIGSAEELAQSYTDSEWAAFENSCAKASD
jgi:hypothetical protein